MGPSWRERGGLTYFKLFTLAFGLASAFGFTFAFPFASALLLVPAVACAVLERDCAAGAACRRNRSDTSLALACGM